MDRQEVFAACERLNREHPRRREVTWVPRELNPGDWVVARVVRQRPARPEFRVRRWAGGPQRGS